ncbi:MAG: polysaccharide biosynthesis tyrosine autokinase [Devosia sp.]|nr:polysaccharide biosynthesis tyrosine autokinase [Devosia sp.]
MRYRWLIAAVLGAGLVLGVVVTLMQSPKFAATARIEIMVPTARILQDMDVVAQSSDIRTFETAKEKLKSRDLARRVVLELNLANNGGFLFPQPDFAIGNIFARVFGAPAQPPLDSYELEQREAIAIERLLKDLSVSLMRGTSLLEVRFADNDPQQASTVANQVVRSYMDQQVDRSIETSELAQQFINEQVADTKAKLEASEAKLVAYSKEQQLGSAGEDGSLISASITAINNAMATAVQTRLENERLVAQIEAGNAAELKQVLDSEAIQATREKLANLRAEYQQKRGTFKPEFPDMQRLAAQIAEFERQLQGEVEVIANSIRLAYETSIQEERDLLNKLAELDAEQVAFRDKNIQYTILKRDVESYRTQYQSLIDKRNELGVVSDLRRVNIDVVDFAIVPKAPFEPSLLRNLLLFLAAAAASSAAIIYVLELLNNKFSVPDQIESELKLPVLGIIPKVEGDKLVEGLADPRSAISEAYRSLRTSLQFSGTDGAPQTLLVTSSEPGESKSTSAFKLAEEFAAIGNKVLLIDCDLRRPSLHRMFKVDNAMGLSNLLTNTVDQAEVPRLFHRSIQHPSLVFLATGPMVPNPADLLSSARMGAVLRGCMKGYDMVILDGPPVIGLSDALILSRLAEATMLVVAAHQTPRKSARAALKRLASTGGNIVGAMLGKLDVERIEYSYSYRYMYEGYYAYGAEAQLSIEEGGTSGAAPQPGKSRNALARLYNRHLRPLLERG